MHDVNLPSTHSFYAGMLMGIFGKYGQYRRILGEEAGEQVFPKVFEHTSKTGNILDDARNIRIVKIPKVDSNGGLFEEFCLVQLGLLWSLMNTPTDPVGNAASAVDLDAFELVKTEQGNAQHGIYRMISRCGNNFFEPVAITMLVRHEYNDCCDVTFVGEYAHMYIKAQLLRYFDATQAPDATRQWVFKEIDLIVEEQLMHRSKLYSDISINPGFCIATWEEENRSNGLPNWYLEIRRLSSSTRRRRDALIDAVTTSSDLLLAGLIAVRPAAEVHVIRPLNRWLGIQKIKSLGAHPGKGTVMKRTSHQDLFNGMPATLVTDYERNRWATKHDYYVTSVDVTEVIPELGLAFADDAAVEEAYKAIAMTSAPQQTELQRKLGTLIMIHNNELVFSMRRCTVAANNNRQHYEVYVAKNHPYFSEGELHTVGMHASVFKIGDNYECFAPTPLNGTNRRFKHLVAIGANSVVHVRKLEKGFVYRFEGIAAANDARTLLRQSNGDMLNSIDLRHQITRLSLPRQFPDWVKEGSNELRALGELYRGGHGNSTRAVLHSLACGDNQDYSGEFDVITAMRLALQLASFGYVSGDEIGSLEMAIEIIMGSDRYPDAHREFVRLAAE